MAFEETTIDALFRVVKEVGEVTTLVAGAGPSDDPIVAMYGEGILRLSRALAQTIGIVVEHLAAERTLEDLDKGGIAPGEG